MGKQITGYLPVFSYIFYFCFTRKGFESLRFVEPFTLLMCGVEQKTAVEQKRI